MKTDDTNLAPLAGLDVLRAESVAFAAGRNGYWRLSEETQRDRTGALLALSLEAHKRGAALKEHEKRRAG